MSDDEAPQRRGPKPAESPEKLKRTVFVGNVSIECTRPQLERHFSAYGKIESSRFRSVPVKSSKVARGDRDLIKRVGAITKQHEEGRDSKNAYVVFEEDASAKAALAANGTVRGEPPRPSGPRASACSHVARAD